MITPTLPPMPANVGRSINLIVVHCSATRSGQRIDRAGKNAAQVIDEWHQARSFKRVAFAKANHNPHLHAIGYHYVIDIDGTILSGRSLNETGAHAQGFNRMSIGICLIGGAEREANYTPNQWLSLAALVKQQASRFKVPLQMPDRLDNQTIRDGVCGHRDLSPDRNGNGLIEPFEWLKTCPGFSVEKWLSLSLTALPGHIYMGAV